MVKIDLPEGILARIINRIHTEQRLLTIKRRLVIFSLGFAGSLAVFIPAFKMLCANLIESGFLQFFSLLFSDFKTVAIYWQNFAMSLLETLPAFSLAIFLTIIFILLESSKLLVKDIRLVTSN